MSEYLSKKALLEWLESEMSINKGHPDDIDIHWTLNRVSKKILSGAFDADESEGTWKATAEVLGRENAQLDSEIQRLRAALERIAAVDVFDWSDETFQGCVDIAREALSTTSEPTVAERVRERYKNAEHLNATTSGATAEYYLGVMNGITDTLNDLGITIPGINAAKGDGNDA